MKISTAFLAGALASLASAQVYFTTATLPSSLTVGTDYKLSWLNDASGDSTVTIYLAQGPQSDIVPVLTVAANQPHNGSYTFTPTNSIPNGTYAFKIVDDSDANDVNYSGTFAIDTTTTGTLSLASSVTVAKTSSSVASSSAASSSAAASSTAASSSAAVSSTSASNSTAVTSSVSASSKVSSASTGSTSHASTQASSKSTSTTHATATSSSAKSTVTADSAGDAIRVGGSLLAVVAGVMVAL